MIFNTLETVGIEHEMVEQPDAQEVSRFAQSCGQRPIFGAQYELSDG